MINLDIREAVLTFMSSPVMVEEGINEAFADSIAHNISNFERLPAETKDRIKNEFTEMAYELSSLESGGIHSDVKTRNLARWFKGVNLLLASVGKEAS